MTDEEHSSLHVAPARTPESSDWRFAVLILTVLVVATLAASLVLFVQNGNIPEGFGALGGGFTGALIVVIGRRVL